MKFLAILLVAAVARAEVDWNNLADVEPRTISRGFPGLRKLEGRVVGGEEAVPHSFPYQAGLIMTLADGRQAFCGGSLISQNYVLTAAHCADGVESIEVILGAHKVREQEDTQVRMTSKTFIIHQKWSSILLHDDIALVKLPESVELNDNIQLVTLPSRSDEHNKFDGEMATVSGWGKDSDSATGISPVLRFVAMEVLTNLRCLLSYPIVRPSHICTSGDEGKSSCNGDSGGPLTASVDGVTKQVGLVSFGRADGCERGHPAVFTRITSYLDWIEENSDVVIQ